MKDIQTAICERVRYLRCFRIVFFGYVGTGLLIGWVAVIFGLSTDFLTVDAGGALLVGCSVFAESIKGGYSRQNEEAFREMRREPHKSVVFKQKRGSDGEVFWGEKEIQSTVCFNPEEHMPGARYLFEPSWKHPHFYIGTKPIGEDGLRTWTPEVQVRRIGVFFDWLIGLSAILGTLLWAFGDHISSF